MFFGFEDSLKDLKRELKTAGADMTFVKDWQKAYDKVRKQKGQLEETYNKAKKELETVYSALKAMEQMLITGNTDVCSMGRELKKYQNSFNHEFLISKEDADFYLIYQTILSLCEKKLTAHKDVLILQSEVENLLALTKEALEKEWPEFKAMAFYYIDRTDKELSDLPHIDKVAKVQRIYENEFIKPMYQVISTCFDEEKAKQIMEVELWI